jgi:hypothetical protein
MGQEALMAAPTAEERAQAVEIMTRQMTSQGMEPEDAAKAAEELVSRAVLKRGDSGD